MSSSCVHEYGLWNKHSVETNFPYGINKERYPFGFVYNAKLIRALKSNQLYWKGNHYLKRYFNVC